jgi:hypothetical protein
MDGWLAHTQQGLTLQENAKFAWRTNGWHNLLGESGVSIFAGPTISQARSRLKAPRLAQSGSGDVGAPSDLIRFIS